MIEKKNSWFGRIVKILSVLSLAIFSKGSLASIDKTNDDAHLIKLQNEFETGKYELSKKSRTAKLWIQYLDWIATLKMYIKAKRIGNWTMQLQCTRKMVNLFAGTGHVNYDKSTRLHLQIMLNLDVDHPWLSE